MELVCGPDMICSHCPNCNPDEISGSDGNHVAIKDRNLLPVLDLKEGTLYPVRSLFKRAEEKMSEESFDASCGRCEGTARATAIFRNMTGAWKEINRIFFL